MLLDTARSKRTKSPNISNDPNHSYCPKLLTGNPKLLVNVGVETIDISLMLCNNLKIQQNKGEYGMYSQDIDNLI